MCSLYLLLLEWSVGKSPANTLSLLNSTRIHVTLNWNIPSVNILRHQILLAGGAWKTSTPDSPRVLHGMSTFIHYLHTELLTQAISLLINRLNVRRKRLTSELLGGSPLSKWRCIRHQIWPHHLIRCHHWDPHGKCTTAHTLCERIITTVCGDEAELNLIIRHPTFSLMPLPLETCTWHLMTDDLMMGFFPTPRRGSKMLTKAA